MQDKISAKQTAGVCQTDKKVKNYSSGGPKRLICFEQTGFEDAFWNPGAKCRLITAKRCFTHGLSLLQGCWRNYQSENGQMGVYDT